MLSAPPHGEGGGLQAPNLPHTTLGLAIDVPPFLSFSAHVHVGSCVYALEQSVLACLRISIHARARALAHHAIAFVIQSAHF